MSGENSIQEDSSTNEETYNLSDLRKEIHEIYKIVTAQTSENNRKNKNNSKRDQKEFCDDVFTIEEKRKLIQIVQSHKKLYDENFKKYKGNRGLWKKISRELGGKCHLGTKFEWQKLKSRYFREAIRSEDPEYQIKFEFYDDLVFLEPYNVRRNQKNPIKKKIETKRSYSPQPGSSRRRSSSLVNNETKEEKNRNENEDTEEQEIQDNIPKSSDPQVEPSTKQLKRGKAKEKKVRKSVENENKQEEIVQNINNIKETHNNAAITQDINNLKETISSLTGLIKDLSDNVSEMKADRNDVSEFISRQSNKKY